MKKILAAALALLLLLSLTACSAGGSSKAANVDPNAKSEDVMTYAQYVEAPLDSEVTIEAFVQGAQSWWDNTATIYAQDGEGGYFLYGAVCSEEDYAKLTPGTKIKVKGYKSEWSGEVEIVDGTIEFENDKYVADAVDVTELLGKDELINKQNMKVAFKGMTIEAADEDGAAFIYNWDGSGSQGDDLYFNASIDGNTYTFSVESYLCDSSTDVYKTVEALQVGQTVDMEGFLYWYEGSQPHITSVTVK